MKEAPHTNGDPDGFGEAIQQDTRRFAARGVKRGIGKRNLSHVWNDAGRFARGLNLALTRAKSTFVDSRVRGDGHCGLFSGLSSIRRLSWISARTCTRIR